MWILIHSITEQVIPKDLLAVHSEIVRDGEVGSDADVSEDMHYDESASGVQEGSNDMSSESDPFLAPTYGSEESVDDLEVNEQGEPINIVFGLVNVPSPVNVQLLVENMPLTITLPASCGENVEGGIASGSPQVEPKIRNGNSSSPNQTLTAEVDSPCVVKDLGMYVVSGLGGDVPVKKRSKTIEQAAPISIDEAAGSIGCHPQTSPPVVTIVESAGDCGMDVYHIILVPMWSLTMPPCLAPLGATLPLVSDTVVVLGSREPVPVQQEEVVPVQ
ncbi:hypothetical protein IFM89_017931 [Coptis chinensis]|uniref:Uncharacterized protein n=1 Tax=Coptis chinensis TaxID=261450 RepID=A0A835LRM2_9MAGN|nr:hypothetical protein IFM89_017931 [Coptis chinensis]